MDALQSKELELLKEFIAVCDKLKLRYYLVCGSVLGAVKYGGFIPWDDDIDVALLREDYEVFCREAQALLPVHLFVQNFRTDPGFAAIYSKLRDSKTAYIESSTAHLSINHGIAIDIFPLDGYPDKRLRQGILEVEKKIYIRLLSSFFKRKARWKEMLVKPVRFMCKQWGSASIARRYTERITRYPAYNSRILANHGNWQGKLDYFNQEVFGDGVIIDFEGMPVRIPILYDEYLTQKYGNYWNDLPPEKQMSHHCKEVVDVNRSYREYFDMIKQGK